MNNQRFYTQLNVLTVLMMAFSLAFLTGCANMATTAPSGTPFNGGGTMNGTIYGGNQPIGDATVQLYSAGTTGYGSAGTLYATTTTTVDGTGSFQFTQTTGTPGPTDPVSASYACPATGNPQMYLLATGGNPGGGTNVAAAELVAIGPCSTVGNLSINMNEVTTVATMAAMQQYFNPTADTLGSPNTTQALLGFANAQAGIANLVNIATGTVLSTSTPASSVTGVVMTATPEATKINTMADILAACVNTTGAVKAGDPCSVLFANAVPQAAAYTSQPGATFATATDIVQAVYYMLTNPTESQDNGGSGKLANIYALASAQPPFVPILSTQPLDWTIGISFMASGTCPAGVSTSYYLNATLKSIAIDAAGDVWVNGGSGSDNSLSELSPVGAATACYSGTLPTGLGLTIDPTGNVWSASASSIYEVPAAGGSPITWTTASLSGIVSDKSGNIFYSPSTATPMQEFIDPGAATSASASTSVGGNIVAGTYLYLAADQQGRILAPISSGSDLTDLYPVTPGTNGYTYANVGSSTFQSGSYGAAIDSTGEFIGGNTCCASAPNNTFYKLSIAAPLTVGATPVVTSTSSAKYLGGLVAARGIAVDGAGNVWAGMNDPVINANPPTIPGDVYALAEVSNDLSTGISPNGSTPATCSSTGPNCQTMGGFQKAALLPTPSVAIDLSGNVWAASSNANHLTATIYEIVGQAVPVVTPLAVNPGVKP